MTGVAVAMHLSANAAQPPIRVGRSTSLSGPISANAAAYNAGSDAAITFFNKRGGIDGRTIELIDRDDGYDPVRCIENTRRFVDEAGIVALFQYIGTPTILAASRELSGSSLSLLGAISGNDELKDPKKHPNVFVVRANSAREAEKLIEHNSLIGITSFAVFYQDDEFGRGVLADARMAIAARNMKLLAEVPIARGSTDVNAQAALIERSGARAVLMFATAKPCALLIAAVKKASTRTIQFMTVSTVSADLMGAPEYQKVMTAHASGTAFTYPSLEGFLNAKVLIEVVRKSGPRVDRSSVRRSLSTFGEVGVGGIRVNFSDVERRGASHVELSVIESRGRVIQ